MTQDADTGPCQSGSSPYFSLKVRDKTSLACGAGAVLSGSDVDTMPSNDAAAKPAEWTHQVNGSSVDPSSPVRPIASPSHNHLRRNNWLAKIGALKNRIHIPSFSSLDVFSLAPKEAGDVAFSKENQVESREDGVDPSPRFTAKKNNVPSHSEHEGSRLVPLARTKGSCVDGCEDDGMPVPTRKRIASCDCSLRVDSVCYDSESSHCVDDMNRLGVGRGAEICQCVECHSAEHSYSVDSLEEYCSPSKCVQRADTACAPNVNYEHFSDSTDDFSSSVDATVGRQASGVWQPHEPKTILSDIGLYNDLQDACICLVENGCFCSMEECQCPNQDATKAEVQGMKTCLKTNEDTPQKANPPEQSTTPPVQYRETQLEGSSTDLNSPSYSNQMLHAKATRRRNNKLSERVNCKRRMSPKYYDTEVDPKKCDPEEAVVATGGKLPSDETENVHPSQTYTNRKTSCMKGTCLHTEVTPDIFYSEDYGTCVDELPSAEISVGDAQLLLDCIVAAHDTISKAQRAQVDECIVAAHDTICIVQIAQVDDFEKSPDAEGQVSITSQTEVTDYGFNCHTEVKSKFSHGTLTKTDALAFKTNIVQHVEDEDSSKFSSQTSCNFRNSHDSFKTEKYNVFSARNKASGQTNMGDKDGKTVTLDTKSSSSNTKSTNEISISPLKKNRRQLCAAQAKETVTKETNPNLEREVPASDASFEMATRRVLVSRIPKRLFKKTPGESTGVQREASGEAKHITAKQKEASEEAKKSIGEQKEASEEAKKSIGEQKEASEEAKMSIGEQKEASEEAKMSIGEQKEASEEAKMSREQKEASEEAKMSREQKEASEEANESTGEQKEATEEVSICQIKSTQSRSSHFFSKTTQSKESENNSSRTSRSYTKIPHARNSRCTRIRQMSDSTRADEEKNVADTTTAGSDHEQTYVHQMITFSKQKDKKAVTTRSIPPSPPKSRKIPRKTPKELPDWNCSTAVEKSRKCNRPPPLVSKRTNNAQPVVKVSSESSKQSLSSTITAESADGLSPSLFEIIDIGRSLSEHNCQQQGLQKTGTVSSSPPKQPFRPAGTNTGTRNIRRKITPASNTARSHPDLRVPGGRVDFPIVSPYRSTASETSSSKLMTLAGTKRAQEMVDDDCKMTSIMLDNKCIYPHTFLEKDLNANSSNSAAWSEYMPILPALYPKFPVRTMFLVAKSAAGPGPKYQKNDETKSTRSASTPIRNNIMQVARLGQKRRPSPKSKLPVPCWRYEVRKLGCVRSASLKMRPITTEILKTRAHKPTSSAVSKPTHKNQPERARCAVKIPVCDFVVTFEGPSKSQAFGRVTPNQQRRLKRREKTVGTAQHVWSTYPKYQSTKVTPKAALLKYDFNKLFDDVQVLDCFPTVKVKND